MSALALSIGRSTFLRGPDFSFGELPEGLQFILWGLGAVAAYYIISSFLSSLRSSVGSKNALVDAIQEKFFKQAFEQRQAEKHASAHNFLAAGEIYERLEMWEKAVQVYTQGQEYLACAAVYEKLKQVDKAIGCYLQGRDHVSAANLALSTGRPSRAAEILEHSHNFEKAAEVYLQVQNYQRAAELLERSGGFFHAGQAYEKAGDLMRAAQAYEKGFNQTRGFVGAPGSTGLPKDGIRMALASAALYDRIGETGKAIEICAKERLLKEAAQYATKARRYKEAANFYSKLSNFEKAAEMLELAGDARNAASMRAEAEIAAGRQGEAAMWFDKSGDHIRAAELYEWEGNYREAAACYLKNDSFVQAAEAYLKADDKTMAAQMYERGGDYLKSGNIYNELKSYSKAAELLERAESYFEAGMAAKECSNDERALVLLQKVPSSSDHYLTACVLLGKLFVGKGQFDLAIDRYMKATGNQPIQAGNAELYYLMAEAMEKVGRKNEALGLFKKISQEDYSYKDVRDRIKALEEETAKSESQRRLSEQQIPATGAPGATSPDGVDRYTMLEKIGEGGMGMIYKAQDKILKRTVALKILSHPVHTDAKIVDRFFQEARSAAALNHPNIVTVFDVGKMGNNFFISMEYIEGQNFMALIEKWKRLTIPQFIFLTSHLCQALDYAHKEKIIHRDIKPTNIMLTKGGQVKITDFGLAKLLDESSLTDTGAVSGTPYYMSPEQIQGKKLDPRTDIYSLGATLYHLLIGQPPFQTERVLYQHLFEKPTLPSKLREDLPITCDKILLKCLEKDPDRRYKGAIAILEDLKKLEKT